MQVRGPEGAPDGPPNGAFGVPEDDPLGEGVAVTTILIYAAITILGVMAAATAKELIDNSWDLGVLVVSSAIALSLAHAWAGVLAQMMVRHESLSRHLVLSELRFAGLALVPAGLVVLDLAVLSLLVSSYELEVTLAMLTLVGVLFLAGFLSALHVRLSRGRSLIWGVASATVGLAVVLLKVALGA